MSDVLCVVGVTCPTCGPHDGGYDDDLDWFGQEDESFTSDDFRRFAFYCLRCDQPPPIDLGPTPIDRAEPRLEPFRLVIATEPMEAR